MNWDLARRPPPLTPALPGVGGRLKDKPEDFEVEEIPAYQPSGSGEFLYLWIEKRDLGAEYFVRQIARRLRIGVGEVGTAGLKDRRAVTRQWVSVPGTVEPLLNQLDGDGLRVLQVSRHSNKLRPGHLHGNRFRLFVRDVAGRPQTEQRLAAILDQLHRQGLPNYYGLQRFGRDSETLELGWDLLRGEGKKARNPFLKKLALSAVQSAWFNHYLGQRLLDGLFRTVLSGDVMAKLPFGGLFVAQDVSVEQRRFDAREIVTAGPIFGRKTFASAGQAAERERQTLETFGLTAASFAGFGKLMPGTRRHNLIYLDDLVAAWKPEGLHLSFSLPAGSYATVLLSEIMKTEVAED